MPREHQTVHKSWRAGHIQEGERIIQTPACFLSTIIHNLSSYVTYLLNPLAPLLSLLSSPLLFHPNHLPQSYLPHLQTTPMHNLIIHSQLPPLITNNQHPHRPPPIRKAIPQPRKQIRLIQHRQPLLHIPRLCHGHHAPIVADIQHAVLLENGAEHVLHHDRRARVADKAALLVQLLGEEVDAQVAVLARLSRGRDADDLAGAALQDEEVADADVVAGDGDGVGGAAAVVAGDALGAVAGGAHGDFAVFDNGLFFAFGAVFVAVVLGLFLLAVEDAVGSAVETVAETVVMSVFVVVSHISSVSLAFAGRVNCTFFGDPGTLFVGHGLTLGEACFGVVARVGALVLPTTLCSVLLGEGSGAVTEVSLSGVDAGVDVDLGGWSVTSVLAVVDVILDVDPGVGVSLVGLTVAVKPSRLASCNGGRGWKPGKLDKD